VEKRRKLKLFISIYCFCTVDFLIECSYFELVSEILMTAVWLLRGGGTLNYHIVAMKGS